MIRLTDVFQALFDIAEIVGTVAFAASGAMLAIDRELDLFGVIFLGVITAVGGGILRDMLLGILPPSAFIHSVYVAVAFVVSLAVFLYAELRGSRYWRQVGVIDRVVNLLDAVGLGIFSVVGVQTAIGAGHAGNAFLCLFMAMTTGVGGGVLRDVLSVTTPAVLKKRIYAVASLAGGGAYYGLIHAGVNGMAAMFAGMLLTVAIRVLATRFQWDLPKIRRV